MFTIYINKRDLSIPQRYLVALSRDPCHNMPPKKPPAIDATKLDKVGGKKTNNDKVVPTQPNNAEVVEIKPTKQDLTKYKPSLFLVGKVTNRKITY